MQRLGLVFSSVLLMGALAGPSAALAGTTDWAVNGRPLSPGQQISVRFASVTPIEITVPAQEIEITCSSWKARGTLVGGDLGTGELVKPKLAHCTELDKGVSKSVKAQITTIKLQTDFNHPVGAPATTEFTTFEVCFAKGRCEPALGIKGVLDGLGPSAAGNLLEFPEPSLPASTLTLEGSPALLTGEATFTLPKHATLSQVEL
jgi:hypothetical protein